MSSTVADSVSAHFLQQENQYFVLIDAGGGTVDIVSYQVKKLHPVLQLEQVGKPTGMYQYLIVLSIQH